MAQFAVQAVVGGIEHLRPIDGDQHDAAGAVFEGQVLIVAVFHASPPAMGVDTVADPSKGTRIFCACAVAAPPTGMRSTPATTPCTRKVSRARSLRLQEASDAGHDLAVGGLRPS